MLPSGIENNDYGRKTFEHRSSFDPVVLPYGKGPTDWLQRYNSASRCRDSLLIWACVPVSTSTTNQKRLPMRMSKTYLFSTQAVPSGRPCEVLHHTSSGRGDHRSIFATVHRTFVHAGDEAKGLVRHLLGTTTSMRGKCEANALDTVVPRRGSLRGLESTQRQREC